MRRSVITSATTDFYMTSTMDEATLAALGADMNKGYETVGDNSRLPQNGFSDLVQKRDVI
jgi:hypothetical protein